MAKQKASLLKNCVHTLLNDEQARAVTMAAECSGLAESTLVRRYVVVGLIQDKFLQHPAQKYADAAKKAG